MRPLDLLVFRGGDFVSNCISVLEKRGHANAQGGNFTHAGMIVDNTIIDEPLLLDNTLYILESTASGKLGSGVYNIYGHAMIGVQIRTLDDVIHAYDVPSETAIAWCPLIHNPLDVVEDLIDIKDTCTKLYRKYNGRAWDANCWSLCSALYPPCRPCRPCIERVLHTEDWVFCSELVADYYVALDILPKTVIPANVLPADLVYPNEDSDDMPVIVSKINEITTQPHFDK